MGIFDHLVRNIDETARKADMPPDQVQAIADTLQDKLGDGHSQDAAISEAARKHRISVEKLWQLLKHAGCPGF